MHRRMWKMSSKQHIYSKFGWENSSEFQTGCSADVEGPEGVEQYVMLSWHGHCVFISWLWKIAGQGFDKADSGVHSQSDELAFYLGAVKCENSNKKRAIQNLSFAKILMLVLIIQCYYCGWSCTWYNGDSVHQNGGFVFFWSFYGSDVIRMCRNTRCYVH